MNKLNLKDRKTKIIIGVVGAIILFLVIRAIVVNQNAPEAAIEDVPTVVSLAEVSEFTAVAARLKTVGTVTSASQVDLTSQVSGAVRSVKVKIGDQVSAGQVIAELDQSMLLAQIDQARAGVSLQNALLDQLRAGSRPEQVSVTEARVASARKAVVDAETSLDNLRLQNSQAMDNLYEGISPLLADAVASANDALYSQTDGIFDRADSDSPTFTFSVGDSQAATDALFQNVLAHEALVRLVATKNGLGTNRAALDAVLNSSESDLTVVRDFLSRLLDAVSSAQDLPDATESAYKLSVSAGRSAVNRSISSIVARRQAVSAQQTATITSETAAAARLGDARNALDIAELEMTLQTSGATQDQVRAQEAQLAAAQAAVNALLTQLDKTVVRAPIGGSVVKVPVRLGEILNPGQPIVTIVDTTGLEVRAYLGNRDVAALTVGDEVEVEGSNTGIVTRIAAGVDSATGKVEVGVSLRSTEGLVAGQLVNVEFVTSAQTGSDAFRLPLAAVKTGSDGSFVFTVDESGKIIALPIETGEVLDGRVEVLSGLETSQRILRSVRGINEGDEVTVE
ncbi:MAG: HlyD family efflux transporter periplasmic adaptor subunit [Patescibacteria group bacterium]